MLPIISSGNRGCCSSTVPIREPPLEEPLRMDSTVLYCTSYKSVRSNEKAAIYINSSTLKTKVTRSTESSAFTEPHGVTSQKTEPIITTIMRTSSYFTVSLTDVVRCPKNFSISLIGHSTAALVKKEKQHGTI
jgi:hypothetical protein